MLNSVLRERCTEIPGRIGLWLENTESGETYTLRPKEPFEAASVIKLIVMLAAYCAFEEGRLNPGDSYRIREEDKLPSCGALTYMHTDLEVTWRDLVTLMIILSDNTATNILIQKLGMENINSVARQYELSGFALNRLLFDSKASARGIQNYATPSSVASFYRKLLSGELVSSSASKEMLHILLSQRLNGKIPFFLHAMDIDVAHKTGEDDGISHDTGILFANKPIIAVFLSNGTDVAMFERFIQDASLSLVKEV